TGRRRLTGCARSCSASRTSLTRYAALDARQYAANAATASSQRRPSPSFAAKTIPAKSSRFFDHWRGRSATSHAVRRPPSATASTAGKLLPGGQEQLEAAAEAVGRLEADRAA